MDSWIQRFMDSTVHGFNGSWIQLRCKYDDVLSDNFYDNAIKVTKYLVYSKIPVLSSENLKGSAKLMNTPWFNSLARG